MSLASPVPPSSRRGALHPLALALLIALPSLALGALGDRWVDRAQDLLHRPAAASVAVAAASVRAPLPRDLRAVRVALSQPAPPIVTQELLGRLGILGTLQDVALVDPFLESRSMMVRQAAFECLGRLGGERAVERLAAFARGPATSNDVGAAMMALARSPDGAAAAVLAELSRSPEAWRRQSAQSAMAVQGGPAARRALHTALLTGPLNDVWFAANNVALLGEAADARLLMQVASQRGPRGTAALGALNQFPASLVDAFMLRLARTATGNRRGEVLAMLGMVEDPAVLDLLDEAATGSPRWRYSAWIALGTSKAPGALERILDLVAEVMPAEASMACAALGQRPEPEARDALRALAVGDDALADAALSTLALAYDAEVTGLLLDRFEVDGRLPPPEAMMMLAVSGGDEGWDLIEEVLANGLPNDRANVVWALTARGDEDAVARLLDLAKEGDPNIAMQAMGALESMDDDAIAGLRTLLVERVERGDAADWGQSMQTLARLGGQEARELLVRKVGEGTMSERSQAVAALASMDDPEAQGSLVGLFRATEDPIHKSEVLNALLWGPDGAPDGVLMEALDSGDPSIVAQAAAALPSSRLADGPERLRALLEADDVSVRSAALSALAQSGDPDAEELLRASLGDEAVSSQALWGLQALGTPGAREAVLEAARSGESSLRGQAIGALASDSSREATEVLIEGLRDSDPSLASSALAALSGRGTTAAAEAIADLLSHMDADADDPFGMRSQAAGALQAYGGRVLETHRDLVESVIGDLSLGAFGDDGDGHGEEFDVGAMLDLAAPLVSHRLPSSID